jgi:hypothetical protein
MPRAAESPAPRPSPADLAPTPPEWAVERLIKRLGKGPAAAGRALDALSKMPVIGLFVRLFSSVWLGIFILSLIGIYIAIGSGFPELRAKMEMTDLQFFNWWPMQVLLAALVLDLAIVTLRRIPLTLFKLGSWTVHVGIVTLIGGCVWYFSHKQEGSFRIYLNKSVNYCYDTTERALFAFPVNADGSFDLEHPTITPLPKLPIYYEHLPAHGNPVNITLPGAMPGTAAAVRIYGYYPCAVLQPDPDPSNIRPAAPGEKGLGPGIGLAFSGRAPGTSQMSSMGQQWLFANTPASRLLDMNLPFVVEYLRQPTPQRLKDLQTSFEGSYALTVRIPKLNIERTYAVKPDEAIVVEGSPYTITPRDMQAMPMLSKGYEGTASNALTVDVVRKDAEKPFNYQRMCVARYPELSPDFIDEDGKKVRKQGGVDPDIQMVFHDASRTEVWIVEDAGGGLTVVARDAAGKSTSQPLSAAPVLVPVTGLSGGVLQLEMFKRLEDAAVTLKPVVVPPEQRPRGQQVMEVMQLSMIEVEVSEGAWKKDKIHVPFSPYAQVGDRPEGDQPAVVELPGGKKVGLLLATTRRELPSTLTLTKFEPIKYPGAAQTYADYRSTLVAVDKDSPEQRTLQPHLNNPASDHDLYYFQSAWDGKENQVPEKRYSVIGVGNRPGVYTMITGSILIALGIGYAFYIKPLLLKAKKEFLARWAAAQRDAAHASARSSQGATA